MSIDVEKLSTFDAGPWESRAAAFRYAASQGSDQAESLRRTGVSIKDAWRDTIGDMIGARCEEQAQEVERLAKVLPKLADVLTNAAARMEQLRGQLLQMLAIADANRIRVLDSGRALPIPETALLDPKVLLRRLALARAISANVRQLLHVATVVDMSAASALAVALGLDIQTFDLGPLDFSDDGILDQVDDSAQGSVPLCAFLSPLMSLGRSNPEFIRQHVVWDPVSQTYEVTMYDPETGAAQRTTVDPRHLQDPDPRNAWTKEPNYLSIYVQAMRQLHPEIESSNFPLTGKIVLGKNYTETQSSNTSFDSIRSTLSTQPPGAVMVATTNAPDPQPDPLPKDFLAEKKIFGNHAYSVIGFTDDGKIRLQNPHGPASHPHIVELTEDEYTRWTNGVMQWPAQ
ncbi:MAG: hypothetical protein Q4P15_00230 [Propionibacteriaceae bacterium]|nr:hypothetical protein [Propionibacteriaceae bacterium]